MKVLLQESDNNLLAVKKLLFVYEHLLLWSANIIMCTGTYLFTLSKHNIICFNLICKKNVTGRIQVKKITLFIFSVACQHLIQMDVGNPADKKRTACSMGRSKSRADIYNAA